MYKSIQHFLDNNIENIQKRIRNQIVEGQDIGQISKGLHCDLLNLGTSMIAEILEDMDQELRVSEERKKNYEIVHKRHNSFLTKMGKVRYERTCFKKKRGNDTEYIVDRMFGIKPHENIASDVEEEIINEAMQTSYRKSGEQAIDTLDELSKQTVMNYMHKYDFELPEEENISEEKKRAKIIYIEADEDHVALQTGGIAMPKLVYVHEGLMYENFKSNRKKLVNAKYFASTNETHTQLWERVLDYIYENYDWDSIDKIYIAGDGAGWIRAGTKIIDKSHFVLDRYHLKKYTKKASAHMDDITQKTLRNALHEANKASVKAILERIVELTEDESRRNSVYEAAKYFSNNWDGIQIYVSDKANVIGCSAEGHISHVYSSRLSSRPKGWSRKGVANMANLIVYKLNGGKIIDLVALRRKEEEKKQTSINQRDKTQIFARTKNEFYKNTDIPVISQGKRTCLSGLLKEIRGVC